MNKRFLAMLLALVMVFALAACGDKEDDVKNNAEDKIEEKKELTPEEEAQEALEKFFKDYTNAKIDKDNIDEYISGDELKEEVLEETDTQALIESMDVSALEEIGFVVDASALEKTVDSFKKTFLGLYTYKYDEIVIGEDGKATVKVTCNAPDGDFAENSEVYTEELMTEVFGFSMNDAEAMFVKWAEKEGVTTEELLTKYMSATEEEISKAILKAFEEEMNMVIPRAFEKMSEIAKTAEKVDTLYTYTFEKIDGAWKITGMEEITE